MQPAAAFALGLSLQVKLSSTFTASLRLTQLTGRASVDNAHRIKNESPELPPLPNGSSEENFSSEERERLKLGN